MTDSDQELNNILSTHLFEPLAPNTVNATLSRQPFISTPSIVNARQLPLPIRKGYAYRSGSLENITDNDKQALLDLGIKTIFDLRSLKETSSNPEPEIKGVKVLWVPSTDDNETTAAVQQQRQDPKNFTFLNMYMDLLSTHRDAYRSVLEHVRDHPDDPFLFHCTAGKDRTGVLAALLLSLAGADTSTIDRDYAYTRIGIEPARDFLTAKLMKGQQIDVNNPIMRRYAEIPINAMQQLLEAIETVYGGSGVEGYARQALGFGEEDLRVIKAHLTRTSLAK
ncbi:Tyrosine-protein phosphatase [Cyphellophora attinorum]|uniref:Tyrosine-protein phosphatase n=1 Tax=Cyphellophora attinorum TaxID=1664694 RepID=A0A0N1H107_9EURO|nr:Tyrosine-protein phosphatase [Phialophora attinorum]KPI37822.1 Tyrosine-protein phosphatase [Phialophora attinorum]